MNNMEHMQNFIKDLQELTHMLLDASAGGTILQMTEPQIKYLIEKMCMNDYRVKYERSVKLEIMGSPKGMQQSQQALFQRNPSQLEETLQNFIKVTQSSFEQILLKGGKQKLTQEHVNMTEKEETIEPTEVPPKMKGPGEFNITYTIGGLIIPRSLFDLGSSINVMPLRKFKELEIEKMVPSNMTLTLDNSLVTNLLGIVQDFLVHVNGLTFPHTLW
ncbi:hypothetical protein KIW84_076541 [Lathyrus oleraceus]|uniref:Uncharacterized protein n=1 Tax=Pisum sativum TaxID=3888 RepID=A0A9D4VYC5_PEA|nr:hypothetical protein KIW84_076541 [Pisum sativum]